MDSVIGATVTSMAAALSDMYNVYEVAITGYALALAGSSSVDLAVSKLAQEAVISGKSLYY